jgi:hypothetical protein
MRPFDYSHLLLLRGGKIRRRRRRSQGHARKKYMQNACFVAFACTNILFNWDPWSAAHGDMNASSITIESKSTAVNAHNAVKCVGARRKITC